MIYLLTRVFTLIKNQAESAWGNSFFLSDGFRHRKDFPGGLTVRRRKILKRRVVFLGNHKHVNGSFRIDIPKGDYPLVLINNVGSNLFSRDLTKNTILHLPSDLIIIFEDQRVIAF